MATGKPPWSELGNPLTTMFHIAKTQEPPKLPDNLSPEAIDFIRNCLKIIPYERANCPQLINHMFISGKQPLFKEVDSPPIRTNLVEKEQDFFEIKLREANNLKASVTDSEGNPDRKEDGVFCELYGKNEKKDPFDTILIKLTSKSNTNSVKSNILQENLENMQETHNDKEKLDTSIEGKVTNFYKKSGSYEFFGVQGLQKSEKIMNEPAKFNKGISFETQFQQNKMRTNEFSKKNSNEYGGEKEEEEEQMGNGDSDVRF